MSFLTPYRVNPKKCVLARQGLTPSGVSLTPSPCVFQQLYAPKTSKMLPFPHFFSKTPKLTKGMI
jgi:hypothetical protein